MNSNYYSINGDRIHVLHFPGSGLMGNEEHIKLNIDRKFKVSKDLSIISIMNKPCYDSSLLVRQCENNGINIINTAYDVEEWVNTIKIPHIFKSLEQVDTEYVLILDGRDVLICNDLDDEFIEKFKSFNSPIVYNATYIRHPKTRVESLQDIIHIKSKHKYLNAGVCIGTKEGLYDFYKYVNEVVKEYPNNDSEQLVVRVARRRRPQMADYDWNIKMFAAVHHCNNTLTPAENGTDFIFH